MNRVVHTGIYAGMYQLFRQLLMEEGVSVRQFRCDTGGEETTTVGRRCRSLWVTPAVEHAPGVK